MHFFSKFVFILREFLTYLHNYIYFRPSEAYSSQFQSSGIHTQKSPLKTPVPRSYVPEPVSKNVKISRKENPITEKENVPKSTHEGMVSKLLLSFTGMNSMVWGLCCVFLPLLRCWAASS